MKAPIPIQILRFVFMAHPSAIRTLRIHSRVAAPGQDRSI
jgi:hypothetical protein